MVEALFLLVGIVVGFSLAALVLIADMRRIRSDGQKLQQQLHDIIRTIGKATEQKPLAGTRTMWD